MTKDYYSKHTKTLKSQHSKKIFDFKRAKDLKRYLPKENIRIASKHMKKRFTLYVLRELQIETMRYHYKPIRMAKALTTPKCWERYGAKGSHLLVGMQKGIATLEDSLVVYLQIKHTLTIQSSECPPWNLPQRVKNACPHKNLHTDI